MKTFKIFLILFLSLIIIQCKEETDKTKKIKNETVKPSVSPEDQGTISVTVYNYQDKKTMGNVDIAIIQQGVTIGQDKTNLQGNVTLTGVENSIDYIFDKDGYISQSVRFMDYEEINKIYVFLKPNVGPASPPTHVRGTVSNGAGLPIKNVRVSSDGRSTQSQQNGFYSLDIPGQEGTFPISYLQGDINGSLRMGGDEDTIIVDVFIDGFTNDSIFITKK